MSAIIVMTVLLLAYSNGANDNFKGVATLFGSGTANYRWALAWATLTTLAGSLLALMFASDLVDMFQGKGWVPDAVKLQPAFLSAVSLGAALTVLLATYTGLPVSTTHALTGGLLGAALVATAGEISLVPVLSSFLLPLLCSPVLGMLLTVVIYATFRCGRRVLGITSQSCLCVGGVDEPVQVHSDGSLTLVRTGMVVQDGTIPECVQRYQGRMLGLEAAAILDGLHYLSAGAVGFARGLNDTPKIVTLLLASQVLSPRWALTAVAVFMALGGVFHARKVAETMSRKITRMNPGQGFTANLVTSLLVVAASRFGLPVSTTHVSVGSLFGIGTVNGTACRNVIVPILLAWITTLPLGALLAGAAYWALRDVGQYGP